MSQKYLSSKIIKFSVVLLIFVFLIFLNPKGFFSPFRNVFLWVAYPFQKASYFLGSKTAETFYFIGSISEIKNENQNLIKENNSLLSKIASLESEKRENEKLRKELGLAPREKFDLETAFVMAQNNQETGNWLEISKGSSDGIREGMPVIVSDGILVGRIGEVFGSSSRVNLLLDPTSFVNAIDLETGSKGIVRGEFGLGIVMDLVDQGEALNQGDLITTSGLGEGMPKGLLIGKIQEIKISEDKLFQQAVISPRVRYSRLETVFVIKNQK